MLNHEAPDATPLEQELIALSRKTCEQPARLTPDDLDPLRMIVADGALDYAFVAASFHFINRISDLLGIVTELLPAPMRRFEFLRRMSVRLMGLFMTTMDLSNRQYGRTYDEVAESISPIFKASIGTSPGNQFESLRARPKIMEAIQLTLDERDQRSSLDRSIMATIHRTVERALPKNADDLQGFDSRPDDPIAAFAFIGTRYAHRTTRQMMGALRGEGFDDLGILDLAIAIADANQWARLHRLLGLPPDLFYLS